MDTLAPLLPVPVIIGFLVSLFNQRTSWPRTMRKLNLVEYGVLIVGVCLLAVGGWFMFRDSQFQATEWLNGEVVSKQPEHVSCSHSYEGPCNSWDDKGNCTGHETLYEHSYDQNWYVYTNYNFDGYGKIEIPRVDRQGLSEPPEFTAVNVGDPWSSLHPFPSWIKPSGDSDAFPYPADLKTAYGIYVPPMTTELQMDRSRGMKVLALGFDQNHLPPGFGMYTINGRIVAANVEWNEKLHSVYNKVLGPSKQANVQFFEVNAQVIPDPNFGSLVEGVWRGSGKNDIDIFIGTDAARNIVWVTVKLGATEQNNELFVVKLRDAILALKTVDEDQILETTKAVIESDFNRKEMKTFLNRKQGVHPTTGQMITLYVLDFIISLGGALYLLVNDPFQIE